MTGATSRHDCFLALLERYVRKLRRKGDKVTGCSPCHDDKQPSFSADIGKCCWYCHTCNTGGGIKDFAQLVGEPWSIASLSPSEKKRATVSIRRREAEEKARAILQKREEERLNAIFEQWRDVNRDAADAAELFGLFHRSSDFTSEFSDLAMQAARDYGAAIHRRVWLEAVIDGEVEA